MVLITSCKVILVVKKRFATMTKTYFNMLFTVHEDNANKIRRALYIYHIKIM